MSRTDKDVPHWVRVSLDRFEPSHEHGCPYYNMPRFDRRPKPFRDCNLPERPVRQSHAHLRGGYPRDIATYPWQCTWEAPYDRDYWYDRPPSQKDRHLEWYGPDRAQVRDQCREALKEYHGSGEAEVEVLRYHHRHASKKGWWN